MSARIKSTLSLLPAFGLALLAGFCFTVHMTGSADTAIERMVVAVVLWVICALVWGALSVFAKIFLWISHTCSNSHRESQPRRTLVFHSAGPQRGRPAQIGPFPQRKDRP